MDDYEGYGVESALKMPPQKQYLASLPFLILPFLPTFLLLPLLLFLLFLKALFMNANHLL